MRELEFEITKKDCINYNKDALKIPRVLKQYTCLLIIPAIFFIISLVGLFLPVEFCIFSTFFPLFLCFLLAAMIIAVSLYFTGGRQIYKALKGSDLKRKIIITKENIYSSNETSNGTVNWDGVVDIYNKKNTIIIFLSEKMGIMIPKRVFESELDAVKFYAQMLEYYNNAKNS